MKEEDSIWPSPTATGSLHLLHTGFLYLTREEESLGAIKSCAGTPDGEFLCMTSQHLFPMSCRVTRAPQTPPATRAGWTDHKQHKIQKERTQTGRKVGVFTSPKWEALKLELRKELTESNFSSTQSIWESRSWVWLNPNTQADLSKHSWQAYARSSAGKWMNREIRTQPVLGLYTGSSAQITQQAAIFN